MTANLSVENFDSRHALDLHARRGFDELSEYLLRTLESANGAIWVGMPTEVERKLNEFLAIFLDLLSDRNYVVPELFAARFIDCNPIIMNLAALSAFRTTDKWITLLLEQPDNLVKVLTLYNARSNVRIDTRALFDANARLASLWYVRYFHAAFSGNASPLVWQNLHAHAEAADDRFEWVGPASLDHWFLCSYVTPEGEARVKRQIHRVAKAALGGISFRNRPRRNSIAIVSSRWAAPTAVYRTLAPYVEALAGHYEMTLIQPGGEEPPAAERRLFSRVVNADVRTGAEWLREVVDNDFALAWFPDIGMDTNGKLLAELRMAPIQAMGYGHPVSTCGGEIDYFIGGQEVEPPDQPESHYSERLVLLPGLGVHPMIPAWAGSSAGDADQNLPVVVNCSWSAPKTNFPHLQTLRRIADRVRRPVRFRFFPSHCMHNGYLPLREDIIAVLGVERVEVVHERSPSQYLDVLAQGAFGLDSWPFGGFNTIIDSLTVGRPVATLQGSRVPGRFAAAALRRAGLPELVAVNEEEYVALAVRLVDDASWREELTRRVAAADWRSALRRVEEPRAFRRAIDFLIENHDRLRAEPSRQPILIP